MSKQQPAKNGAGLSYIDLAETTRGVTSSAKSINLPNSFIASLPRPDSPDAVEKIKTAAKKYHSSMSITDRPGLMRVYALVAKQFGFKTWEALVAVSGIPLTVSLPTKPGATLQLVAQVIQMALDVASESRNIKEKYNASCGKDPENCFYSATDLFEMCKQPTPKRDSLRSFLKSLDVEELRYLVALMYAGRGDADFAGMKDYVDKGWDHERCVTTLIEKAPLAKYLQKGMNQLK